jgi:hypothetical protein
MALTENNRWISVQGPVKVERIHVTSDGTDEDTIATLIQNPITTSIKSVNTDLAGTADPASTTVSGKTITVYDPNAQDYVITAEGF